MEYLQDVLGFCWAVINNWAGYTTGGLIVALLWLWSTLKQRPISRKLGIAVALIFLFFAIFNAWRDQHRASVDCKAQLDKLTLPKLTLGIDQVSIGTIGAADPQLNGRAGVFTVANVKNDGAPSIAENYRLAVALPDGTKYSDIFPFRTTDEGKIRFFSGAPGSSGKPQAEAASQSDALFKKTFETRIESGTRVRGILTFAMPKGVDSKSLKVAGTKLTISCMDITGKSVESSVVWKGDSNPPMYYPGLTYPDEEHKTVSKPKGY